MTDAASASRALRETTDAELALLAVVAIMRQDVRTEALLDVYDREAERRGLARVSSSATVRACSVGAQYGAQ